jgi:uncharacterized membrane protein
MLHTLERISGGILWANLHLLFWLSLVPFATAWMSESHSSALPTAGYGFVLLAAGVAYLILQTAIIRSQGPNSKLRRLLGHDVKGKASAVLYIAAIAVAFVNTRFSQAIYVFVALSWLVPDRRIEARFAAEE